MVEFLTSQFGVSLVLAVVVMSVMLGAVAYCIYFERKISAWIQDRYGPNRVGPRGLLQPIADGAKFLFKEDVIPDHVDKPLFVLAPTILFIVAFVGFAAIPWGGQLLAANTDKRGVAARKLLTLDCCTLRQNGDDGVTVTFEADHLEEVAAVMRPKRRRAPMSPEHRAKLVKAGEAHRFKPRSHGTNRPETARECDERVLDCS